MRPLRSTCLAISFLLFGCSTSSSDQPFEFVTDAATEAADASADIPTLDVVPGDGANPDRPPIYAHTSTTLYTADPTRPRLALTEVGDFDCIGGAAGDSSMTDIAVDQEGTLYGISTGAVYLDMVPDGPNAAVYCTQGRVPIDAGSLGNEANFYGMTFAPPTSTLGTAETLIAANTIGDLYMINRTTGRPTLVGKFGPVPTDDGLGHDYDPSHVGQPWALSGDMVFLHNNGNPVGFATVRDCADPSQAPDTCSTIDTLVEIDINALAPITPTPVVTKSIRGMILPAGCSDESCGYGSMYGIAALDEKVYGFSFGGTVVAIDNDTGEATFIDSPFTTPGFAGAGVTTIARVVAPPPK
jgi:hypothetical protein